MYILNSKQMILHITCVTEIGRGQKYPVWRSCFYLMQNPLSLIQSIRDQDIVNLW